MATFEERFWAKVEKSDGCWLWTACTRGSGYGGFWGGYEHGFMPAHRASWIMHFGPILDGLLVLHRCDVKMCVRPDHLFLGTQRDNMQDAIGKGRRNIRKIFEGYNLRRKSRTHCPKGHLYDENNLIFERRSKGGSSYRACRTCKQIKFNKWYNNNRKGVNSNESPDYRA